MLGEILIAGMAAMLICIFLGPRFIEYLRLREFGQQIREEGPEEHHEKAGTPTMGGLLIFTAISVPYLVLSDRDTQSLAVFGVALGCAAIGFIDDYLKITRHSHYGLYGRYKILGQILIGVGVGLALVWMASRVSPSPLYSTRLIFPFFKGLIPDLGWWYVPFATLVVLSTSNTVNLTDGLDGLAISTFAVSAAAYTALAYVTGHRVFAQYLQLVSFPPTGELTIFCGALVGASLGFLWWNAHPADIFMGDVGSLALGGALGTVAILIKQELLLPIVGGLFVLEALSVILQVGSFKLTGQRIFRMAPLHHHFELIGWSEPKVISRFLIVAVIFALFSLTTLKLR